jgi:hypothetical protein
MKYLKLTRCDGIYEYIPLENMRFGFVEIDDNEYRVEMTVDGRDRTLFEKMYIADVDKCMERIAKFSDGIIVDAMELFG